MYRLGSFVSLNYDNNYCILTYCRCVYVVTCIFLHSVGKQICACMHVRIDIASSYHLLTKLYCVFTYIHVCMYGIYTKHMYMYVRHQSFIL